MSFHFIGDRIKTNLTHVCIYTDKPHFELSSANKKSSQMFFLLQSTDDHFKIAKDIADLKKDICVDLSHINDIDGKLIMLNSLAKCFYTSIHERRDILIKDLLRYRGLIQDGIHQVNNCGNIVRNLQNQQTSPEAYNHKVQAMFRNEKVVDVKKFKHNDITGLLVEYIKRPELPYITLVGSSIFNKESSSKYWSSNTGSALTCGIIRYFSHFASKYDCNIVGILPILDSFLNDNDIETECIMKIALLYNPKFILHIGESDESVSGNIFSHNSKSLDMISNISERLLENISVYNYFPDNKNYIISNLPVRYNRNYVKFEFPCRSTKELQMGNGLLLCINFVKKITKIHGFRQKKSSK